MTSGAMVLRCSAILIGGAVALTIISSRPGHATMPAPAGSLCTPAETPLFSCAIGVKRVAVCAAGRQATYRYGGPGRIEVASTQLTTASQGFSGGGETQITATNKGYGYTVFNRTTRTSFGENGRNDPAEGSGLLIRQGSRMVASKMCDDDVPVSSKARTLLPAGTFVRH